MDEPKTLTFVAPSDLARALRIAAAVRGINRSEWIRAALRDRLAEERDARVQIGREVGHGSTSFDIDR